MTLQSSQLGRGGHRDDRRRRLLAEDLTASFAPEEQGHLGSTERNAPPIKHKSENYGEAEFLQTQPRLTDLVPRHPVALVLLLKAGLAAIAGLIALYVAAPALFHTPNSRPALANLGHSGSLANWFAELLLLAASFFAAIIYTVRRHRIDDYRGRYRVWLWAAACWFVMATDLAGSLHQGFQQTMISCFRTPIVGDGSIWWLAPAVIVVGTIGVRLWLDMRTSRLAGTALVLAAVANLTALTASFHGIKLSSPLYEVLLLHGSLLAGHLFLAWSMVLQARFVLLDAEGRLPRRTAKPKKQCAERKVKKTESKSSDANHADAASAAGALNRQDSKPDNASSDAGVATDRPQTGGTSSASPAIRRVDPPATSVGPPLSQKIAARVTMSSPSDSQPDGSKLSKADRKAMKKRLLEERLRTEQRKASHW